METDAWIWKSKFTVLTVEFPLCVGKPDKEPLCWDKRLKIAIGAARVLSLLHILQIIHRDVTPSNILLDEVLSFLCFPFYMLEFVVLDHYWNLVRKRLVVVG